MCARRGERWIERAFTGEDFHTPLGLASNVTYWAHKHAQWDLYWCVHGFSKPRRLERYAVPTPYAWLDLIGRSEARTARTDHHYRNLTEELSGDLAVRSHSDEGHASWFQQCAAC